MDGKVSPQISEMKHCKSQEISIEFRMRVTEYTVNGDIRVNVELV